MDKTIFVDVTNAIVPLVAERCTVCEDFTEGILLEVKDSEDNLYYICPDCVVEALNIQINIE